MTWVTVVDRKYIRHDDTLTDSVRAAVFGELVRLSEGMERWRSDLFYDAQYIAQKMVPGEAFAWFRKADGGTHIGDNAEIAAGMSSGRLYGVVVTKDARQRWHLTVKERRSTPMTDAELLSVLREHGGRTVTCAHGYGFRDSCPMCD